LVILQKKKMQGTCIKIKIKKEIDVRIMEQKWLNVLRTVPHLLRNSICTAKGTFVPSITRAISRTPCFKQAASQIVAIRLRSDCTVWESKGYKVKGKNVLTNAFSGKKFKEQVVMQAFPLHKFSVTHINKNNNNNNNNNNNIIIIIIIIEYHLLRKYTLCTAYVCQT